MFQVQNGSSARLKQKEMKTDTILKHSKSEKIKKRWIENERKKRAPN